MDLYAETSYQVSELVTKRYSTSFSASTRLFAPAIRRHIYAIYGLVRIADEIVDTYKGKDAKEVLDGLKKEVYAAFDRGYSSNPVVEAFMLTATRYSIGPSLIEPFFSSMLMDLQPATYSKESYNDYIYGSAEVVGLMCLRVFCQGDEKRFKRLEKGAQALGAAYQKVNFLRDMAADYRELGRVYFPGVSFDMFDEADKQHIIADIENDFLLAKRAIQDLPAGSRHAVEMSVVYYEALLKKLKRTPSDVIKQKRIRIHNAHKAFLFITSLKRRPHGES